MNTHNIGHIVRAFFAALVLGCMHSAHAGVFRTYLSVNGNDANPCTVVAPCRLLPAALAAVNDGGEIWMLDSSNFNLSTVNVTKSVTILAIPGAVGSLVANGGHAIAINTLGVKVVLRNLNVLNLSGSSNYGIYLNNGAALIVENCEIYGVFIGIFAVAPSSAVVIKSTVIRDTTYAGAFTQGTVKATLDGVHLLNNPIGLDVVNGATAAVSNSVFANSSNFGIEVSSSGGNTSRLVLANSVLNANATGILSSTFAAADVVSVTLQRNALNGNTTGVAATTVAASSTLTVVLDDNALIANGTAISYVAPAAVLSRGNNTMKLNGTDVSGPALTPLSGQ